MSRLDAQQGLMPSILDRLIDPDSTGTEWRQGYGLEQMLEVVRRDLEELLNTRQSHNDLSKKLEHVRRSIAGYGLPDITSFNGVTPQQREEIAHMLEATVATYEPRLKDVRVTLLEVEGDKQQMIRFRIDARLAVDPTPEVAFDTIVEMTTGQHTVKQKEV